MAHRNDRHEMDFTRVLAPYLSNHAFMDAAWNEFCSLVDLDETAIEDDDDRHFFQSLFYEWVLFDYDIHGGKTPLEHFVTWPPTGCGTNVLSLYAQAATSQFTSSFRVVGYNEDTHKVSLENVADGIVYRVLDRTYPDTFPTDHGLLTARIMRVRGTWLFAGNVIDYQKTEPTPEELAEMRQENGEHNEDFCEVLNSIYGRLPLSDADTVASGFSTLSSEERIERLRTAQEEYAQLQSGLELEVDWDGLTRMIREEDGEGSAVTLMDSIVGQDRVDAMNQDELVHTLKPILAAWNLLPHDILNGMTPVEDFEARYPLPEDDWDDEEDATGEDWGDELAEAGEPLPVGAGDGGDIEGEPAPPGPSGPSGTLAAITSTTGTLPPHLIAGGVFLCMRTAPALDGGASRLIPPWLRGAPVQPRPAAVSRPRGPAGMTGLAIARPSPRGQAARVWGGRLECHAPAHSVPACRRASPTPRQCAAECP